jgi:Potential Queuosine, Q, salvage protein family
VLTLDAVNFGSGWFPHLRKRSGVSGYFAVAGALTDHFRAHGRIPPERLAVFTAEDGATLFGQDLTDGPIRELMGLFAQDVARYQDFEVPFYKRAQITVTDLALALGGEGWGRLDDLDQLTVFADRYRQGPRRHRTRTIFY